MKLLSTHVLLGAMEGFQGLISGSPLNFILTRHYRGFRPSAVIPG